MTRWKASAIHLVLSIIVLAVIAAVLVWRWYPPGLFHMANADKLLLIIAGVDVVMGPLLTLIVYKQGKKTLRFDLTVIALLQMAAMGYGLHTVWQSRPVYLVAMPDRFNLVFANDLDPADLVEAPASFRSLPWLTVEPIAALLPKDRKAQQNLLFLTLDTGKDLHMLPMYYAPFHAGAAELLAHSFPVDAFMERLKDEDKTRLASAVRKTGLAAAKLRVVPIGSNRGDASMLIDSRTGEPRRPMAIDAWPVVSALQKANPAL
jgi:hypothetical protein